VATNRGPECLEKSAEEISCGPGLHRAQLRYVDGRMGFATWALLAVDPIMWMLSLSFPRTGLRA
jgi:hypothetical protein